MYSNFIRQYHQSTLIQGQNDLFTHSNMFWPIGHLQGYHVKQNSLNLSVHNLELGESNPVTWNLTLYQKKSFIRKTYRSQGHVEKGLQECLHISYRDISWYLIHSKGLQECLYISYRNISWYLIFYSISCYDSRKHKRTHMILNQQMKDISKLNTLLMNCGVQV